MRFAYGYANAWWPQVNLYRTAEESEKAGAPDWGIWKKKGLEKWKEGFLQDKVDGKAAELWDFELSEYQKQSPQDQIRNLAQRGAWAKIADFPIDERMQLVWENLTLHLEVPEGQVLPGENLVNDHWAKIAGDVDAAYVSNGKEVERYVF